MKRGKLLLLAGVTGLSLAAVGIGVGSAPDSGASDIAQPQGKTLILGRGLPSTDAGVNADLPRPAVSQGTPFPALQGSQEMPPAIPAGVTYAPLSRQDLPAEWKEHLLGQARNLRETGSMSRGRVTHEFARLDDMAEQLRTKGLAALRARLAIQPTELGLILGPAFLLVGADVQGKDVADLGRAGFFQIYRHPGTDQMVELSEYQLDILAGDGTVVTQEMINDAVGAWPATFESLTDRGGVPLINLQWIARHRVFQLTTRRVEAQETRQLALAITQRLMAMPHQGWRRRYEFDPENPVHRLGRPNGAAPR